ncbi:hypothetical protein [Owenweeksia hongkongensis]|uniref:hypothetical protein n=1 Tax=Owenweeksia hongkongensis TaxID=253245 RepID=UPI003A8F5B2F
MTKRILLIPHAIILLVLWVLAFFTDGTGGGGDSITHFFFAQLAWKEPINFFDHWGKPFFTLFASPWAQFGFIGIKFFNIFCGVFSSYLTALIAIRLSKPWPWAITIMAFVAPAYYTFLFSGLTEPFSSLVVVGAVYLCLSGKMGWGLFLASFLPFCRSEAQVFLLFFFVFAVLNKGWKLTPLLLSGYLIYALVGSLYLESPLWIFEVPYNPTGSVYGHGEWLHYVDMLTHMLGVPFIILAGLGLIQFLRKAFIQGSFKWKSELWLVHGIFFSLLVGHTVVWALGIYGSAGLSRTLITVFPLLWLIMLDGLILLKDISAKLFAGRSYILPLTIIIIQAGITFTSPVSKYYYHAHLKLNAEDYFINSEIGPFIKEKYPDIRHFVIDKPYLAIGLGINFIDPQERSNWNVYNHLDELTQPSLFIFDQQYITVQYGIELQQVRQEQKLEELHEWTSPSGLKYVLFQKK